MCSLEALLPGDLEKHVQLSRARLTSYDVLREEITTYCECRSHAHSRNTKPKARHTQVEMTQWTSVHSAKTRAKNCKDSEDSKDKNKESIEC